MYKICDLLRGKKSFEELCRAEWLKIELNIKNKTQPKHPRVTTIPCLLTLPGSDISCGVISRILFFSLECFKN